MFAVKGWSVDAGSLKPQTEIFKSSKAKDGESKSSRKRKRGHSKEEKHERDSRTDAAARSVGGDAEDDELAKKKKKKERKKQKREQRERMKEEKTDPEDLLSTASKPTSEDKEEGTIERWEDIQLSTRPEKKGKKKARMRQSQNSAQDDRTNNKTVEAAVKPESEAAADVPIQPNDTVVEKSTDLEPPKLTPMQSAMRQKLVSARFRHLNQTLYTEPSAKAQELFDQSPEMFEDYHTGFRQQVSVWPENPLNKFIVEIRRRGKIKPPPQFKPYRRKVNSKIIRPQEDTGIALPRTSGTSVIADLGCGDARLAHTLTVSGDTTVLHLKVLSYDLHAANKHVTRADISKLPLKDDSVDVAIFCLALMGTNWISFIEEAHRILHWKGELWVAEIKSRFGRVSKNGKPVSHSVGAKRKQIPPTKAEAARAKEAEELNEEEVLQAEVDGVATTKEETDVSAFVQVLKRRGFLLKPPSEKSVDLRNKMFVKMEFVKALKPIKGKGKPPADAKDASRQKLKFFNDEDEDADTDEESKVLKPCLYKTR